MIGVFYYFVLVLLCDALLVIALFDEPMQH